jgi:cytoplasmic tRNA 2-thiolation protein 2
VAEEAKEEWSPSSEDGIKVRIVRPLRDVGMKECALWAWWCGLPIAGSSTPLIGEGKHGIGSLTQGDLIQILLKNAKPTHSVYAKILYMV